MKCGKCGAEVADGYRFCLICGTKIEAQEEPSTESSPKPPASGSLLSAQDAAGGMASATAIVAPKPSVGIGDASSNSLRVMGEILVVSGCLLGIFAIYLFSIPFVGPIFGAIALMIAILIGFKGANMKSQGKAAVRADQTYQLLQATQERLMRIEGQQVLGQMSQASSAISNATGNGQPIVQSKIACPKCSTMIPSSNKFCPECGASLKKKCEKCGNEVAGETKFCPECGAKVS